MTTSRPEAPAADAPGLLPDASSGDSATGSDGERRREGQGVDHESSAAEASPAEPHPATDVEKPLGGASTRLSSEPEDDVSPGVVERRPILLTTALCALVAGLGHGVLWWGAATDRIDQSIWWPPVFGMVLSVVAITAFGGFYLASRRARVAIGATFVLSFFVLLSYAATITQLGGSGQNPGLARDLFNDFRTIMVTVTGFYFGAETVVTVAKVIGTSRSTDDRARELISTVDRDLPSGRS